MGNVDDDVRYAERHVTFPALIGGLGTFLVSFAVWHTLIAALFLALLGWLFCFIFSIVLVRRWRRAIELRCDVVAASYVDGQELISALRIQDSLISPKQRRGLSYWMASRMFPYPSLSEREEAISRLIKENGLSEGRNHVSG